MKRIIPNYYNKFHCIADRCRHSCCIGWEIEVDEGTLDRYQSIPWIAEKIGNGTILLDTQERCPFLNEQGLCRIITQLGEDALCQICTDHPRFRNDFSDRVEMGLGLCCEAAAELILAQKEPVTLSQYEGAPLPEEEVFFACREQIISVLQDRTKPIEERLMQLSDGVEWNLSHWIPFYQKLERLDPAWDALLAAAKPHTEKDPVALEQLAVYFVYRHLAGALEDGRLRERLLFALLSVALISALPCSLAEGARMYSAEIEYSDENLEEILIALETV